MIHLGGELAASQRSAICLAVLFGRLWFLPTSELSALANGYWALATTFRPRSMWILGVRLWCLEISFQISSILAVQASEKMTAYSDVEPMQVFGHSSVRRTRRLIGSSMCHTGAPLWPNGHSLISASCSCVPASITSGMTAHVVG